MEWTEEQKQNILNHYNSIEEYEKISKIREARQYLSDTDYVVIKMQEYSFTGQDIDNDYTEILNKREKCREILRNLIVEEKK